MQIPNHSGIKPKPPTRKDRIIGTIILATMFLGVVFLAVTGFPNYEGVKVGTIGETLNFSQTRNEQPNINLTVTSLEKVSPNDAKKWGIDYVNGDIYFIRYVITGSETTNLLSTDWALVTSSGEITHGSIMPFDLMKGLPTEANCQTMEDPLHPNINFRPCIPIIVPIGETVTSIRYYGVKNANIQWKQGRTTEEWVTWKVG